MLTISVYIPVLHTQFILVMVHQRAVHFKTFLFYTLPNSNIWAVDK